MQDKVQVLEQIKETDFGNLECRLWVIKKSTRAGVNTYRSLSTAINGLDDDFKNTLRSFFCGSDGMIEPIQELSQYSVLTVDVDENRALVDKLENSDFDNVINKINEGADNDVILDIRQFNNAWALVVEYKNENDTFLCIYQNKRRFVVV